MSDKLRITGMASGLDIDTTVKQLMKAQSVKVDKVKQDKQIVQWKQELYRDIIGDLNTIKSTYFDVLKSDTYMLSANNYAGFDVTTYDTGTTTTSLYASATAGTGAQTGTYKVDFTGGHLAVAAGVKSNGKITTGSGDATGSTKMSDLGISAQDITITYNNGAGSTSKTVAITADTTLSQLTSAINSATSSGVVAKFSELTGQFSIQTSSTGAATTLRLSGDATFLKKLNLGDGISTSVDETTADYKIVPQDLSVKITPPGGSAVTVDDKSANKFTIDGITYNLLSDKKSDGITPVVTDITVTANTQKPYDKIKAFIDKYNEVIEKINTKIQEKVQYDYKPLTDEQKAEMEKEDIDAWEAKAKEGLLKHDSNLENMLTSMRRAFFDEVEGAGVTLGEIGLSTSSDISQRGKIIINETKLKNAIQNNGQQVANLFMKTSTSITSYDPDLSNADRTTRNNEEGIFQRINDILQDYVRTTRNDSGKKGILIEKAGVKGDFTEFNNLLSTQITDKDKIINDLIVKLADKEEKYYLQFSKLEQAMNNMNSQSSWLAQQLGGA